MMKNDHIEPDDKLQTTVLGLCLSGHHEEAARWLSVLKYMPELTDEQLQELVQFWLQQETFPLAHLLREFPLRDSTREHFREPFMAEVARVRREKKAILKSSEPADVIGKVRTLRVCAHLGDAQAVEELVRLVREIPWRSSHEMAALKNAIYYLLYMDSKEGLEAILQRLKNDGGAPRYEPATSERGQILHLLYHKFAKDEPWSQYSHYLKDRHFAWAMDDQIGGEAGVRTLLQEIQDWANRNYKFQLEFTKVTPTIKLTAPPDEYLNPVEDWDLPQSSIGGRGARGNRPAGGSAGRVPGAEDAPASG
jgi:hypothetical protein